MNFVNNYARVSILKISLFLLATLCHYRPMCNKFSTDKVLHYLRRGEIISATSILPLLSEEQKNNFFHRQEAEWQLMGFSEDYATSALIATNDSRYKIIYLYPEMTLWNLECLLGLSKDEQLVFCHPQMHVNLKVPLLDISKKKKMEIMYLKVQTKTLTIENVQRLSKCYEEGGDHYISRVERWK